MHRGCVTYRLSAYRARRQHAGRSDLVGLRIRPNSGQVHANVCSVMGTYAAGRGHPPPTLSTTDLSSSLMCLYFPSCTCRSTPQGSTVISTFIRPGVLEVAPPTLIGLKNKEAPCRARCQSRC